MFKVNKPLWFKSSYWKRKFTDIILDRLCLSKQHNVTSIETFDAVLVTSTDGLGDTFLRLSVLKLLQQKYSTVFVLTQASSLPIFKVCGFEIIEYSSRMRTNVFKRIKLIKQLNALPIDTVYVGEFYRNDNLVKYLSARSIGLANPDAPERDADLDWVLPTADYTGDLLKHFATSINKEYGDLTDNRLYLPRDVNLEGKNQIVFALGAQNKKRMMRVSNMVILIEHILNIDTECILLLVGAGKKEQYYASQIIQALKEQLSKETLRRVNVHIDCYSLLELVQLIYQSKLLIGFDSGPYNLSYTLHKSTICIAAENERVLHRSASWVRIVKDNHVNEYGIDDGYGNPITNAVSIDEFTQAYRDICPLV